MLKAFITNLGKYNEGYLVVEWIKLPASQDELSKRLERIGIGADYEEYFITDYDCEITGIYQALGEYENIHVLNFLVEKLLELDEYDISKLESVLEYLECNDVLEIINAIYRIDAFIFYSEVSNESELAECFVNEEHLYEIPENLIGYIDYEKLGRDIQLDLTGIFSSNGFIYEDGYSSAIFRNEQEVLECCY